MGFLDKLISKLDDDNPAKPVDHTGGYAQPDYHQSQSQQQQQQPPSYYQQPPHQGMYGQDQFSAPQAQGYGQSGYDQGHAQGQGQVQYGHAAGGGYMPPPPGQGFMDPGLESHIRSRTAQNLFQTFSAQLFQAEQNLAHVPPYDVQRKFELETEIKILKAVVGLCQGFSGGTDAGLSDGFRGMQVGDHGAVMMMPTGHQAQGYPVHPYAHASGQSAADKEKEDKKKLILATAGAGAVGLGAGMLLADRDDIDKEEEYRRRAEEEERERGSRSGSASDSSSNGGEYGEDDE